ncbi:hypothetical protein GCM10028812_50820 [Ancylobacter sonchi]
MRAGTVADDDDRNRHTLGPASTDKSAATEAFVIWMRRDHHEAAPHEIVGRSEWKLVHGS